jgi:hypothetical protein
MSRFGPWMSLNNMPQLTATNTLYTIRFRRRQTPDQKAAWALSFLTSYTSQIAESIGRIYADGLVKYEPGDLLNLPLIVPQKFEGARRFYSAAVKLLLEGHRTRTRKIADTFFAPRRSVECRLLQALTSESDARKTTSYSVQLPKSVSTDSPRARIILFHRLRSRTTGSGSVQRR